VRPDILPLLRATIMSRWLAPGPRALAHGEAIPRSRAPFYYVSRGYSPLPCILVYDVACGYPGGYNWQYDAKIYVFKAGDTYSVIAASPHFQCSPHNRMPLGFLPSRPSPTTAPGSAAGSPPGPSNAP
jgi:hypothetical protein